MFLHYQHLSFQLLYLKQSTGDIHDVHPKSQDPIRLGTRPEQERRRRFRQAREGPRQDVRIASPFCVAIFLQLYFRLSDREMIMIQQDNFWFVAEQKLFLRWQAIVSHSGDVMSYPNAKQLYPEACQLYREYTAAAAATPAMMACHGVLGTIPGQSQARSSRR